MKSFTSHISCIMLESLEYVRQIKEYRVQKKRKTLEGKEVTKRECGETNALAGVVLYELWPTLGL